MPTRRVSTDFTIPVFETSIPEPFLPEVVVNLGDLSGPEGNALVILGRVQAAIKAVGADPTEYQAAARSGDYEHLLFVTRSWVRVLETGPGRPEDR